MTKGNTCRVDERGSRRGIFFHVHDFPREFWIVAAKPVKLLLCKKHSRDFLRTAVQQPLEIHLMTKPTARLNLPQVVGRGSQSKPANRFLRIEVEDDYSQLEGDQEFAEELTRVRTEYLVDDSKTILSENNSPDIPFRYSLNPYRGCAHGCAYCYARPTHEYLNLNAGLDFETKIMVKLEAAELLRKRLSKKSWQCEPIMASGVTDAYQPAERKFRLARACVEVAKEFSQPISMITKNALVTRDVDLLGEMAERGLTRVAISLTSLDQSLTKKLEPRTSSPQARLNAMQVLSDAGIEVTVMAAPMIPGLNDSELPELLEAARDHGARNAGYILLRLPLTCQSVFRDWLARHVPDQQEKIESRIAATRGGAMNQSQFGRRMRGTGVLADHLANTFKLFAHKHGLSLKTQPLDTTQFSIPAKSRTFRPETQLRLF